MKELTTQEAILAYGHGKRLRDGVGDEYWLENGMPKAKYRNSNAALTASPAWDFGPFTLVETPHVNPTLEECLAADLVQVSCPDGMSHSLQPTASIFSVYAISYALDKGWKVEVVK